MAMKKRSMPGLTVERGSVWCKLSGRLAEGSFGVFGLSSVSPGAQAALCLEPCFGTGI